MYSSPTLYHVDFFFLKHLGAASLSQSGSTTQTSLKQASQSGSTRHTFLEQANSHNQKKKFCLDTTITSQNTIQTEVFRETSCFNSPANFQITLKKRSNSFPIISNQYLHHRYVLPTYLLICLSVIAKLKKFPPPQNG